MRFTSGLALVALLGKALCQAEVEEPAPLTPCTNLMNGIQNMAEVQAHLQGVMFLTLRGAPADVRQAVSTLFSGLEDAVTKADKIRIKSCDNENTLKTVSVVGSLLSYK
jgi:hypothetical protein